ncbi:MAG TPA: hypothetical protein DEA43_05160 [Candidatus Moranbacteria bacterium]|nr:hypothetical protein [Candidatus Moranbacteria bacterium]
MQRLIFCLPISFLARFWMNAQYPKAQRVAVADYWPKRKQTNKKFKACFLRTYAISKKTESSLFFLLL